MPTENWTETYIKNLPIKDREYQQQNKGLRIRVYPSGRKKWFYHKHDLRGRRESVPLGEFPAVSLAQARQMATVNEASIYTEGHALLDSKKGITFGQFIEGEIYQKAGRKRASHYEIIDNLRAVVPKKIHNLPINHITPTDIEGFIDDRLKEGKKKGTINKNLTNIRSVFKVAFNSGLVDENIMKKVPSLTDDTATEKLALTEDERVRLIRTAEDMSLPQSWKRKHLPIFIHLGLDAGLRKMECLKLRWTDICNDSIKTIDVDIQNIKYQFQTPNVVIAEHKKDGSILDEKQLIRLYDASERSLTVLRLYPSIDQTKKDHKSISDLEKRLEKDGYRLSLDTRRNWYVKVPADKAKSRKSRSIGIRYETMQMIFKYMKELYKDDLNKEAKEGYMFDSFDHNLNPIFREADKDPQTEYEAGRAIKTYTMIGWMNNKLLFPKPQKSNQHLTTVRKGFETVLKHAGLTGLGITLHTLRHEFCTNLVRKGIDIVEVSRLAGHGDIKTTMKYVHFIDSTDFSALDRVDRNS